MDTYIRKKIHSVKAIMVSAMIYHWGSPNMSVYLSACTAMLHKSFVHVHIADCVSVSASALITAEQVMLA